MAEAYRPHDEAMPRLEWPVLAAGSAMEVRVAQTPAEVEAAQRLRYRVFYQEKSAIPSPEMRATRRDFDRYDAYCDHLLVVDREQPEAGEHGVVGTYRLLREDVAAKHDGFYTAGEYDLSAMYTANSASARYLELGRSCILKEYRARPSSMQLLWRGVMLYVAYYPTDVMFGCASFPGTDPASLALPLSYLHHFHRAPEGQRVRARPELYVEMNRMPKEVIDTREALKALPPLIKGYVRAGSFIGDGAVIDRQFDTTDVLIYFPMRHLDRRWREHFGRGGVVAA